MGITKLALERLDGVYYSTVSMARGEAIVIYDSQRVSPNEMVQAIHRGTSFRAVVVSVDDAEPGDLTRPRNCLIFGFFCD